MLLLHKLKLLVASFAKVQKANWLGGAIVDAGIFQLLLVVYEERVTADDLMKFKNMLTLGDYRVFIFDVDEEVRAERMRSRGAMPRVQFGKEYQQHWYEIYLKNDKVVRDFVMRHFEFTRFQN